MTVVVHLSLSENDREVLRAIGQGNLTEGLRTCMATYHELYTMGYRGGQVRFFARQWAKKKPPVKGAKRSTASAKYNPKQGGQ